MNIGIIILLSFLCRIHHQGDKCMSIFQLIRSSKLVSGADQEKKFNRNFKPAGNIFAASISSVFCNSTSCHGK